MTREIRFRAWDKKSNTMSGDQEAKFWLSQGFMAPVYMQYTGLKDKNGKEIYEGDIVQRWSMGADGYTYPFKGKVSVIKWIEQPYLVGWNIGAGRIANRGDRLKYAEVIGNIHETPELVP